MNTAPSAFRPLASIQVLRAVAALLVVQMHTGAALRQSGWTSGWAQALDRFGNFGVDIFFVLSGLLMVATTAHRQPGLAAAWAFMRSRLLRIVPLYWLLTTVKVLMLWLIPGALLLQQTIDWGFVARTYLFIPALDFQGLLRPVLYQGWTLIYEMYFYLLFAALLCFTRRRLVPLLTVLLAGLALLGTVETDSVVFNTYTDTLLLEFAFGCWIGAALLRGWTLPLPAALAAVLAAVGVLAWNPDVPRLLALGVPAALLVAACVSAERRGRWPRLRVMEALGDSSYSLYLVHIFLQSVAIRVLLLPQALRGVPGDLMFVLIIAGCVLGGHLFYRMVEAPIDRRLRGRQRLAPAGAPPVTV